MKIVCLVKQVPRGDAIRFDEETKSLVREGVPLELNQFDAYAVAHAARLRDQHGGEVVAMTMGPPQAEDVLRLTLALGADRCIHLSDRLFAVADTIGTSRTLAMAIAKEGADLVLCGRKTLDSETWQVPAEVAAFLDRPQATNVTSLELAGEKLRVRRLGDEGEEVYELELPAVDEVRLLLLLVEVAPGLVAGREADRVDTERRDVQAPPDLPEPIAVAQRVDVRNRVAVAAGRLVHLVAHSRRN